jgi:hypothetical protein
MLTYNLAKSAARRLGIPTPPVSPSDVRLYCHNPRNPFNAVLSTFPPDYVNICLLNNIEITAEELLAFFPGYLKWYDAIYRLRQNGWSHSDMAQYVNYARGLNPPDHVNHFTTLHHIQAVDKVILLRGHSDTASRPAFRTTNFTAKGWVPREKQDPKEIDYYLVDLADGVVRYPEGDGARLITRAIKLAVARKDTHVRLSGIHQYIRANLLIFPMMSSMLQEMMLGRHADKIAVDCFREARRNGELGG